jgi:hypothetical protein
MAEYNLDIVAVQEVRWDKGGSKPAEFYKSSLRDIRELDQQHKA